ncbi:BnaCnng63160D [Brassica napus]|uniref:BnaCnng63160D protein n=2 Tax=Brassica TaxID=3705 RepID=A0A078JP76_BRANA|nr:BnaCnng63160D [Brassica napus]
MSGKAGMAWVFTNQEGLEVTHGSLAQDHVSSALMAEALAIRSARLHAIDIRFNSIWLRSDSQMLVAALSSGRHPTELYGVLSDIATIFNWFFRFCYLTFIKRNFNGFADSYAKVCLHSGPSDCNP